MRFVGLWLLPSTAEVGRAGTAVAAGAAIALALPPAGWWPAAAVGIGLWSWTLRDRRWAARLGLGALVGATHFLVALAWVPEFTLPGYFLLVALETLFWALASVAATGRWAPLGLAGALMLAEAARYNFPFEGLPLAGIDLGQAGGPLLPAARLGGGYAVTLAVALLGAGLAFGVRREWKPGGAVVATAVLLPLIGVFVPDGRTLGDPLRVAVVQGGGPRGFRGVNTDFSEVLARHLEATATIEGDVDLILWPENSITLSTELTGSPEEEAVTRAAAAADAVLVAGVVEDAGPGRFFNLAYAFDPDGNSTLVPKAIRVPFGEYIPFRSFVDRFADLSAIPSEAVAGEGPGSLGTSVGTFAVSISYEVFFGERSREAVNLGGQMILVPTNAASFKTSQVPGQELAAARLRAVETGRWLLQAAPTGYSAIVNPNGKITQRTSLSTQQVLTAQIPPRTGQTPFAATGPLPILLLSLILTSTPLLAHLRSTSKRARARIA